ncbi:MAG: fibronectin type III domain-containing protein [Akkermansiaceae bacterium]|nr:fibronectin type III domain-containing protein [Akkermansiaceae bacterium]
MQLNPITHSNPTQKNYRKRTIAALSLGAVSYLLGNVDTANASTAGLQAVELGWDAVPEAGVVGYKIHVGTTSNQYTTVIDAGSVTSLVLPGLAAGSTFYVVVTAVANTGLESDFSSEVSFQTAPLLPPGGLHSLNLAWNPVSDSAVAGYRVQVGNSSRNYTSSYNVGSLTTFPVANLEFGKTYYFVVSAIGTTGLESELSSELAVKIAPPPLPGGVAMGSTSSDSSVPGVPCVKWKFPASDLGSSPEFLVSMSSDLIHWVDAGPISPNQSTVNTAGEVEFSWPIQVTSGKMFYRMTARNWMGTPVLP